METIVCGVLERKDKVYFLVKGDRTATHNSYTKPTK